MKTRFWAILILAVPCFLGGLAAWGQDFMHARVSYDAGSGMVKGKDDADWSYATVNTIVLPGDTLWVDKEGTLELEMSGGSFLRMADGSKVDLAGLPPSGDLRGWSGSFYVQRINRSTGSMTFATPVCLVDVDPGSQVRIDILGEGGTTVSARWGHASVRCEAGGEVSLNAGQRSYVDPGYLPSVPAAFNLSEEDDFDSWNRERARLLAEGDDRIPPAAHIKEAPIGASDLASYGEWVAIDNSYFWRPTVVVDYVPYRYGHWSYVAGAGYCWVDGYPFSYVTTHYGRWMHHDHYGWVWTYRDTWGPAWVEAVHYGPNFVWTPLDPFDRPCVAIGESFAVGGAHFGIYASSYCLADDLLMGTCHVMPVTPMIVRPVPVAEIVIWDIHAGSRPRPHHDFAHDAGLPVREYAPRRVIRGFDTLPSREPAHARVATLETSMGRHDFAPAGGRPPSHTATPSQRQHGTEGRSVRVAPEIRESTRNPQQSAEVMRAHTTGETHSIIPQREETDTNRSGRGEASQPSRAERQGRTGTGGADANRPSRGDTSQPSRTERQGRTDTGGPDANRPSRGDTSQPSRTERQGRTEAGSSAAPSEPTASGERSRSRSIVPSTRSTRGEPATGTGETAVRSRSRESVQPPMPMRVEESSSSRTVRSQEGDTSSSSSGLPERSSTRVRSERLRSTRTESSAPSTPSATPSTRHMPESSAAPRTSETSRSIIPQSSSRESSRSVQVERLSEPAQTAPVTESHPVRGGASQGSVVSRGESSAQSAPQVRSQEPVRERGTARAESAGGARNESNDRKRGGNR